MQKEQASANGEKSITAIEAYKILLQHQMNEDHIIVERTTIFLTASSFLFIAFVMLLNPALVPIFKALRIILSITGVCLTFLLYHLNLSATNALHFWHQSEKKIEETEKELFKYMLENKITPHHHGYKAIRGEKEWNRTNEDTWEFKPVTGFWKKLFNKPLQQAWLRPIYQLYIPSIFFVLWVVTLIVAIIN